MEPAKPDYVSKDEVILNRHDINKKIKNHKACIDTMKGDVSLIAQTFAQGQKEQHLQVSLSYLDTLDVCLDLLQYLEDMMTVGVQRTIQERTNGQQEGGD